MKVRDYLPQLLAVLPLLGASATASAASLFLVPDAVQNVVDGDILSFDIHMDFSGDPAIGGAFDISFDSSALAFVSFFRNESIGDPGFARDPDILDGLLDDWALGAIDGIPDIAIVGSVQFQVLPTMGQSTTIQTQDAQCFSPCWISADFVSTIIVDYGDATVSRVPLPAALWLMLSGLGVLYGGLARST